MVENHLHGIVIINDSHGGTTRRVIPDGRPHLDPGTLGAIIGQIKSVVTKRVNAIGQPTEGHIWQRGYYEHIIRNDADLFRIRKYITLNPLRWLLGEESHQIS